MPVTRYRCEYAWLPDGIAADVEISVSDGKISAIRPAGESAGRQALARPGLTMPGFANAHSHAFHRALRGRTHADLGTFWTWREQMYSVAAKLDPDSYHRLARAVFAEMALAGISCVGEFHYLHHDPDGTPYAEPNAMGHALIEAAREAGIRITLLDTLYLTSTVDGKPLTERQLRFGDGDAARWADRVDQLTESAHCRVGAAVHSVRAVPTTQLGTVAAWAGARPLHAHVSEQQAENEACLSEHGRTPTQVLADFGVLHEGFTAVHATHLTHEDVALLSGSHACFCPTTERDLGDGIGPARMLAEAGTTLTLGSDSNAVIDLFEEARALEMDERLASRQRGHFAPAELLHAATAAGHACLGWLDAGRLAVGCRADLVTVALDSPRTAGIDPGGVLFAAGAADVTHVVVDGRPVVADGRHTAVDVTGELKESICALF